MLSQLFLPPASVARLSATVGNDANKAFALMVFFTAITPGSTPVEHRCITALLSSSQKDSI
jgi:hypothetical protein